MKTRIQFDVTPEAAEELEDLMKRAGVTTKAELFRNSLKLMSWFVAKREEGSEIQLKKGDKVSDVEFI